MTEPDTALAPCPFCGGVAYDSKHRSVWCSGCEVEMHDDEAVDMRAAWNTRHPAPRADALRACDAVEQEAGSMIQGAYAAGMKYALKQVRAALTSEEQP